MWGLSKMTYVEHSENTHVLAGTKRGFKIEELVSMRVPHLDLNSNTVNSIHHTSDTNINLILPGYYMILRNC